MTSTSLAPAALTVPHDAAALDAQLWPSTARRNAEGALEVGGVSVQELAREFGTPLYVLDEAHLRERANEVVTVFREAFADIGTEAVVYYAGKAFLSAAVARWVSEAGMRVDVCSGGELALVLAAGVPASEIGFHGNNKSAEEIARAVAAGVGAIVLDHPGEVEQVAAAARTAGRVQAVRLRVNSGVHASTHEFLATAHEDQKFGLPLDEAAAVVADIRRRPELNFLGLHCHIGSQIFGASGFAESAARLLGLHEALLADGPVPELNLGGGFGVAYTPADEPTPIAVLAREIAAIVAAECAARGIALPAIAFEPGRSVIAQSTLTLYTAGAIKDVRVPAANDAIRRYISVDGGMSDNARPALYGAAYTVRLAGRVSAAEQRLIRLAGKHCESGDILIDADYLPGDVSAGDLLAVPVTGAYCWALSSNYNFLARPAVVAVAEGSARVIVRGETEADLLARDAGLDGK